MKDVNDDKTSELPLPGAEPKRGRGRPAKHANAAAKQKAYREKKKAAGQRELRHWVADVRDDSKELRSDVIDLSEVRQQKR